MNNFTKADETYNLNYPKIRQAVLQMLSDGWDIRKCLACIHDLYQEYLISEEQEVSLYYVADPCDQYNNVHDYWNDMDYENPLIAIARQVNQ